MIELAVRGLGVLDSESEDDLRTPNGKKAFRDAINAAAYYSDRLSTRSARGKKLKAMAGEPNGSARPFGRRWAQAVPDGGSGGISPTTRESETCSRWRCGASTW